MRVNPGLRADEVFAAYLDNLPLQPGDTLNHARYESIKGDLLRIAAERGYFDAEFRHSRVEVDLQNYQARVVIDFHAGARYRFGEIILPDPILEPDLMRRYIRVERGSPYRFEELISLRQALNDSDFFHTVEVAPGEPDRETREVPIRINLSARKPNRYSLGLGFGTDTGARASLGWERPLINDDGHRFRSELDVSEIGNSVSAHYSIPVLNPRSDRLVYTAALVNEETDTSDSRIETVGISLNRGRGDWRESLSLEYQREDFSVADIDDSSALLIPGASWSRTSGSSLVFTLDGIRLDIDVQGAHEDLWSDVSFLQVQGGIKFIKRLSTDIRLLTRGRLGTTWTSEFDELPSSVRFFTGGAQTVRGFAYQTLGPEDEDGDVEGGKHLMIGSVELDLQLQGNWGIALFMDAGNAINDLDDDLERSVGFGLRWQSPVGPVRFDFGSAISRSGDPWRLHINIGPDL